MRRVVPVPAALAVLLAFAVAPTRADARQDGAVRVDRAVVRYVSPETGGSAHPRFLTERELAFFARVEALIEQTTLDPDEYPERYVHAAVDRLVARSMLASLMIQRGVEPPELPRLSLEARGELEARVGSGALADALKREGIDEDELLSFLRDQVRATYYIDRAMTPILSVTEDALRAAFRSMLHPYRKEKFDDVRSKLRLWLVTERLRAAELEFFQGARARVKISAVRDGANPGSATPIEGAGR